MSGKETVQFTIKGPISVQCNTEHNHNGDKLKIIGCSIIDLHFNHPSQFGELVFTNFYTAFISIYVKHLSSKTNSNPKDGFSTERSGSIEISEKHQHLHRSPKLVDDWVMSSGRSHRIPVAQVSRHKNAPGTSIMDMDLPWECSIHLRPLMPWPHFECGSQDVFSFQATESLVEWRDVIMMRLVIHQPSSVWKHFTIEDINVFRNLPKRACSHPSDVSSQFQKDSWFLKLKGNTKRMLSGHLVEPEPENQDNRKES